MASAKKWVTSQGHAWLTREHTCFYYYYRTSFYFSGLVQSSMSFKLTRCNYSTTKLHCLRSCSCVLFLSLNHHLRRAACLVKCGHYLLSWVKYCASCIQWRWTRVVKLDLYAASNYVVFCLGIIFFLGKLVFTDMTWLQANMMFQNNVLLCIKLL